MKFEFSLTAIVRYAIPGFVGIACFLVLPSCIFNSLILEKLNTGSGIVIAGVAALTLGYLFDILKVYRLTIGYKKGSKRIEDEIARIFCVDKSMSKTYLSRAASFEEKSEGSICVLHSKWVMAQKCVFTFYLTTVIWFAITIMSLLNVIIVNFILCIIITIFCAVLGIRLNMMCCHEQARIQKAYIDYMSRHKDIFMPYSNEKGENLK